MLTDSLTEKRRIRRTCKDPAKIAEAKEIIKTLKLGKKRSRDEEVQLRISLNKSERISKSLGERRSASGKNILERNKTNFNVRNNLKIANAALRGATTGIAGSVKVALASIFPSIDVTNEGVLGSSLTKFALASLQSFKGPTTEFEFRVAESINGKLGDPKTSIKAKLNVLDLTTFLSEQRDRQLNNKLDNDDFDPKRFRFNGSGLFGGQTINDIADITLKNNLSVDEALQFLNSQGRKKQGGQIMIDAQGNRARVFPDGTFEEL